MTDVLGALTAEVRHKTELISARHIGQWNNCVCLLSMQKWRYYRSWTRVFRLQRLNDRSLRGCQIGRRSVCICLLSTRGWLYYVNMVLEGPCDARWHYLRICISNQHPHIFCHSPPMQGIKLLPPHGPTMEGSPSLTTTLPNLPALSGITCNTSGITASYIPRPLAAIPVMSMLPRFWPLTPSCYKSQDKLILFHNWFRYCLTQYYKLQ